ncbi:MAG TPA: DUF2804 family protein [Solirubrobacterales bacterium]|nr:DUF2804 family protein [Solirubrobacterales bacterium]
MPSTQIPWRGPGSDRPDLPLPPSSMPLRRNGQLRKRWRYVGVFAPELMLCAARAEVGPLGQSFWVMWDREGRRHDARTTLRPGSREVTIEGPLLEIDSPGLRASLRLGQCLPIETICPSGSGWGWTRKRSGVPIEGTVEVPGRRWEISARGVDDESAGYHQRRTSWRWSAGVGRAGDGRRLAWNLVEGVNDPAERSERAIWVDGEPIEPAPVSFRGMEGIDLAGEDRLEFASESAHARDENFLILSSRYRHRFGTFSGALAGLQLAEGLGVMEEHDALW